MIRYIEVCVTPFDRKTQGGGEMHTVEIMVRTQRERVCLKEIVDDAMFASRFHWMLKRIEREVIERSGVANID